MLEACAKVMAEICWTAWDQALWEAGCKCHQAGCRRDAACVIPSEGYQCRHSFFIASSSLDQRPWAPVCPSLSLGVPPFILDGMEFFHSQHCRSEKSRGSWLFSALTAGHCALTLQAPRSRTRWPELGLLWQDLAIYLLALSPEWF